MSARVPAPVRVPIRQLVPVRALMPAPAAARGPGRRSSSRVRRCRTWRETIESASCRLVRVRSLVALHCGALRLYALSRAPSSPIAGASLATLPARSRPGRRYTPSCQPRARPGPVAERCPTLGGLRSRPGPPAVVAVARPKPGASRQRPGRPQPTTAGRGTIAAVVVSLVGDDCRGGALGPVHTVATADIWPASAEHVPQGGQMRSADAAHRTAGAPRRSSDPPWLRVGEDRISGLPSSRRTWQTSPDAPAPERGTNRTDADRGPILVGSRSLAPAGGARAPAPRWPRPSALARWSAPVPPSSRPSATFR